MTRINCFMIQREGLLMFTDCLWMVLSLAIISPFLMCILLLRRDEFYVYYRYIAKFQYEQKQIKQVFYSSLFIL